MLAVQQVCEDSYWTGQIGRRFLRCSPIRKSNVYVIRSRRLCQRELTFLPSDFAYGLIGMGLIVFIPLLIISWIFPTWRIIFGILMTLGGIFMIVSFGWLFGLGLFFGFPSLIIGILFVISGMKSGSKSAAMEGARRAIQEERRKGMECSSCGKYSDRNASYCQFCGSDL